MGLIIKTQEVRPRNFMVTLDGRLDTLTYAQLDSTLKMIFLSPVQSLQLDFGLLSYISSMGLRSIMMAAKQARAKGVRLTVVRPQPQVLAVLEIGRALPTESVFASVAEADRYLDHIQKEELAKQGGNEPSIQF